MRLEIVAIKFRHDANSVGTKALKIRKNAFKKIAIPEWQRGISVDADDSLAAYAINEVLTHTITIQVKFELSALTNLPSFIMVRAVHPELPNYSTFWESLLYTQVNVLGEVKEKRISINQNGETGFETFDIKNHKLQLQGVGIHRVIWRWQYRRSENEPWTDFAITQHKIYTLIDKPTEPWVQTSDDDVRLPWTDVMDYACQWAAKAKTMDQAASYITRKLYFMGPQKFEYNCINFLPAYVQMIDFSGTTFFNCTSFLQHLQSGNVNRYIICSDCAAIISTFANILGCDLWQSTMLTFGTFFRVNRILPIGTWRWQIPCGLQGFSFHEVAWKGSCTSSDPIFDACLAIDGSPNPQDVISWPLLPTNMLMGYRGSGLYRDKLVFPPDWLLCEPKPHFRQRRLPVLRLARTQAIRSLTTATKTMQNSKMDLLKQHYNFEEWRNYNNLDENLFIKNFFFDNNAFPEWEIQVINEIEGETNAPGFIYSIWRRPSHTSGALRVDVYECPSRMSAQEFALQLLGGSHISIPKMQESPKAGDIAFTWIGEKSLLFTRANLVFMIANVDKTNISVISLAYHIDKYLCNKSLLTESDDSIVSIEGTDRPITSIRVGHPVVLSTPKFQQNSLAEDNLNNENKQVERTFYKFFSPGGEIMLENGSLIYQSLIKGNQQVTVFSINSNQHVFLQNLQVEVEG